MGFVNVGGGSTSVPTMNVFAQTSQPTTYEGIWLNTSNTIDSIKTDNSVYLPNAWITNPTDLPADIPSSARNLTAVAIGIDIFIFTSPVRKYNTVDKTYTELATPPHSFFGGSAVAVGTDVYLFGEYNGATTFYRYAHKYNTLNNTFTQLANIPYDFALGSVVAVGTDIYLFGSGSSTYYRYARKYNTLNNTYSTLTTIPYDFYNGAAVAVGTDIYLFGSGSSTYYRYARKYDTLNNTYSTLIELPYDFVNGSAVAIGTDIYLFGGASSTYHKYAYKFNVLNSGYTRLSDIPYAINKIPIVNILSKIYLLGTYIDGNKVQVYSLTAKEYAENQLVITRSSENTGTYSAQLFPIPSNVTSNYFGRFLTGFNSVYLYKNSTLNQYPTYYGTGSAWTQFITV